MPLPLFAAGITALAGSGKLAGAAKLIGAVGKPLVGIAKGVFGGITSLFGGGGPSKKTQQRAARQKRNIIAREASRVKEEAERLARAKARGPGGGRFVTQVTRGGLTRGRAPGIQLPFFRSTTGSKVGDSVSRIFGIGTRVPLPPPPKKQPPKKEPNAFMEWLMKNWPWVAGAVLLVFVVLPAAGLDLFKKKRRVGKRKKPGNPSSTRKASTSKKSGSKASKSKGKRTQSGWVQLANGDWKTPNGARVTDKQKKAFFRMQRARKRKK